MLLRNYSKYVKFFLFFIISIHIFAITGRFLTKWAHVKIKSENILFRCTSLADYAIDAERTD